MASVAAVLPAGSAPAQTLAQRVAQAPDGRVHLSFAARPGVCGNGRNIITTRGGDDWESDCTAGPVRVSLTVRNREVTGVRTYVGGRWRTGIEPVTDLGTVSALAAADYLLALAERPGGIRGRDAIFPASLADSIQIWLRLLRLARNESAPRETRRQAVFWLGQAAAEEASRGLDSLLSLDTLDRSVQEQVVFALSQRPHHEGVPVLLRVARTHRDPAIRKKAIFWLAQSSDPRALTFFEDLLGR
ncbi:MAG: HEAT repeat domain-containing protein [Gemmatimonadetes bacterium]|nr:HEAT repeat domain-containing protein [Gemmatimonadota bacterium]